MHFDSTEGWSRGQCEHCHDVYDSRDDADYQIGLCGACVRSRRAFTEKLKKDGLL